MTNPDVMRTAAETYLSTPVQAAGIFGLQDDYTLITAAGAAATIALTGAGVASDPVLSGIAGAATVGAARKVNADEQGLAVRMLVAVTEADIHILQWDASELRVVSGFLVFPKASTTVTIAKFGASRRVTLHDATDERTLHISGGVGFLSSEAAGDKLVLSLLQA